MERSLRSLRELHVIYHRSRTRNKGKNVEKCPFDERSSSEVPFASIISSLKIPSLIYNLSIKKITVIFLNLKMFGFGQQVFLCFHITLFFIATKKNKKF